MPVFGTTSRSKLIIVGLILASLIVYALIFNWTFALVLMIGLFWHEYGHVWAMKRVGMRVRGIYFIPLLGAGVVPDNSFPSRRAEVFVALMGPAWGFVLALVCYDLGYLTGRPFFVWAGFWMALINLFNLVPFSPIDGGRVVKYAVQAISLKLGLWVQGICLALLIPIAVIFPRLIMIVILLTVFGGLDLLNERQRRSWPADKRLAPLSRRGALIAVLCYLALTAALLILTLVSLKAVADTFAAGALS